MNNRIRQYFLLMLAVILITARPLTSFAAEDPVSEAKKGVVRIDIVYMGENGDDYVIQTESGFLIAEHYAVTLAHALEPSDDDLELYAQLFGVDPEILRDNMFIRVYANDRYTEASVVTSDHDTDLAVLQLDSSIYRCKALPVRSSGMLSSSDDCYILGFLTVMTGNSEPSEVFSHHGAFKKIDSLNGVEYVVISTNPGTGITGGPLIDKNGNVIGVLADPMNDSSDSSECFAVSSDSLMDILNRAEIPYQYSDGANSGSSIDKPEEPGYVFPSPSNSVPGNFLRLPG